MGFMFFVKPCLFQEKKRENTIEKAQKAGFGTSYALAALHDMPHDSELFQDLLTDVPFDYNWNEEASAQKVWEGGTHVPGAPFRRSADGRRQRINAKGHIESLAALPS